MAFDQPDIAALEQAYRVPPGGDFRLGDHAPRDEGFFPAKADAKASARQDAGAIDRLQDRLYAEGERALLVILQGIDTSGKSGTIKSVFKMTSPLGVEVTAFKAPTARERAHDFLWRVHARVPAAGRVGVFDRSHYEDVLVPKVRRAMTPETIERRYGQINAFEKHLTENRVRIVKFFLQVSREEQGKRLRDRLEKPHKRWKFAPADLEDRERWDGFAEAYEAMIRRCSTAHAPWYVIPADSKSRRNAAVARIVRGTLEAMAPEHPDPGHRPGDFEI